MPHRAREPGTIFGALQRMFAGRSKRDLRRLLRDERILLNGEPVTAPGAAVRQGDLIECRRMGRPHRVHPKVRVVHEDEHILVADKAPGIITSGGVRGQAATVEQVLEGYLRGKGVRRPVRACHRLDRDVSGLLLLAKDPRIAEQVRTNPRHHLADRIYLALVEGTPASRAGTIRGYLRDDPDRVVRRAEGPAEGKLAITHYRVLEAGTLYAILEVRLETGRKNQIRAHLSQIGHPVAGDAKYGARTDPAGRVCLHAARLRILHPVTGEALLFASPPPWKPPLGIRASGPARTPAPRRG